MLTEDCTSPHSQRQNRGFSHWLAKQVARDDQVGRFARNVKIDECWPENSTLDTEDEYLLLRNHIRTYHFSSYYPSEVAAFEVAWEEYQSSLSPPLFSSLGGVPEPTSATATDATNATSSPPAIVMIPPASSPKLPVHHSLDQEKRSKKNTNEVVPS